LVSGAAGNFVAPAAKLSAKASYGGRHRPAGTFNVLRWAWPHLRKPGAAVLNLSVDQSA
jgi:hypothetical protein